MALWASSTFAQSPVISVLAMPPAGNVAVQQAEAVPAGVDSGGIQARWPDEDQFRGLSQTFVWKGGDPLSAIGLRISADQNKRFKFRYPQKYALDVQKLSDRRVVLKTLASVELTLQPDLVQPERFLVITLPALIELNAGDLYGFNLRPLEVNPHNHIIVSIGGNGEGHRFADGVANQTGVPGLISAGQSYGNAIADFDLTFFLLSQATHESPSQRSHL